MAKTTVATRVDWKARHAHVEQQNQAMRQAFGTIRRLLDDLMPFVGNLAGESQITESRRVADEMLRLPSP